MSSDPANSDTGAKRVIFHGRVQGVGFRATTQSIASRFAVTGYVRNQADGTVELIAAGSCSEIDRFLSSIRDRFSANLTNVEEGNVTPAESFEQFEIRR
ncbi:acylphosphatase [Stratiformator vulcanicus]|uniref:acylphosphatase n=1 Tax=Stratiformator vulcanicus TaxID=2527980 RepID=A0A517R6C8_9PLAN|nr:acylphosphatase [Stratiformator vulcanicus]QDT39393.1 Acylphosphatase [Stratiformator vulcanicus]